MKRFTAVLLGFALLAMVSVSAYSHMRTEKNVPVKVEQSYNKIFSVDAKTSTLVHTATTLNIINADQLQITQLNFSEANRPPGISLASANYKWAKQIKTPFVDKLSNCKTVTMRINKLPQRSRTA